ncbi:hypothetical protein HOLleu_08211 [Holothuria leucospilota]|uniref:Uncharacterized protein n=1 Tax=Holothuria leucospilota TaxID=206669 RepID=A0A9Q1CIE0_HOLLE|nr:hypothetical protein HOLleu_08211 [Holothuria leucospilota]
MSLLVVFLPLASLPLTCLFLIHRRLKKLWIPMFCVLCFLFVEPVTRPHSVLY